MTTAFRPIDAQGRAKSTKWIETSAQHYLQPICRNTNGAHRSQLVRSVQEGCWIIGVQSTLCVRGGLFHHSLWFFAFGFFAALLNTVCKCHMVVPLRWAFKYLIDRGLPYDMGTSPQPAILSLVKQTMLCFRPVRVHCRRRPWPWGDRVLENAQMYLSVAVAVPFLDTSLPVTSVPHVLPRI